MAGSYASLIGNRLHLHAITSTDFTRHADIWHNTVIFRDTNGKPLLGGSGSLLDSPPMKPANGQSSGPSDVVTWDRYVNLTGSPSLEFQVTQLTWTGSC
jgi:hypothetical protein